MKQEKARGRWHIPHGSWRLVFNDGISCYRGACNDGAIHPALIHGSTS
jgi:hypothetical protein